MAGPYKRNYGSMTITHATLPTGFPLTSADACSWCHGTGEPQLSVHSLTTTDGS